MSSSTQDVLNCVHTCVVSENRAGVMNEDFLAGSVVDYVGDISGTQTSLSSAVVEASRALHVRLCV